MDKAKILIAEFIGTMVLVFLGCGSAMFLGCEPEGGHLAVALAFGLSVVAMAYCIGNVSGCHINPAVSFGMLLSGRMGLGDFIGYVVAQFAGATAGAGLLQMMYVFSGADDTGYLGSNFYDNAGGIGGGIAIEVLLTFIFVLVILGVTSDAGKSSVAGMVIGLTLTLVHIVGIPLTGTSVNPARSFGPAIFAGEDALVELWVFIVAPLVGAALAAIVFKFVGKQIKAATKPAKSGKGK